MRTDITAAKRWVIHVDSRLIASPTGLDLQAVGQLAQQLAQLRARGIEVVVVSAGAVQACGEPSMTTSFGNALHETQALAAIGQIALINAWAGGLAAQGCQAAQVLLTHDDLSHRKHYLNARSTLGVLLEQGVIPVVSENGTVASHGIRAGDTDTLGSLVVNLVEADLYVMLTSLDGLCEVRQGEPQAPMPEVSAADPALDRFAHDMTEHFSFDVRSWLRSARLAARSGAHTVIAGGRSADVLQRLAEGEHVGTLLLCDCTPVAARARWLAGHLPSRGALEIIAGPASANRFGEGISALMILRVEGIFQRGDMVICRGADGAELARGLVNYSSQEIQRLRGQFVEAFARQIGYVAEPQIMSVGNMVSSGV